MITIVDYGMGNLGSIVNMFKRIGLASKISSDVKEISESSKLLLPGVGSFDSAMKSIEKRGLRQVLDFKALEEKIPILGICLGMQLLTSGSEEGNLPGLKWINAKTKKFPMLDNYKVPHMGWNTVKTCTKSRMTKGLEEKEEARFYFVHSYYVDVEDNSNSIYKSFHGIEFDSAICEGNIFGAQFHPEKSHKFGMEFLKNFGEI